MARFQELAAPAQKTDRKTMERDRKQGPSKDVHGRDPFVFIDCRDTAAGTKTDSTHTTKAVKADDEEDAIAVPTPIHATLPCRLVAADGRVEYVYTPIGGFEHLFKVRDGVQGLPSSSRSLNALHSASQPQQSQTPGAPQQHPVHVRRNDVNQQQHSKSSRSINVPLRKNSVPKSTKPKVLKRTRSVAQGLSQPRARTTRDADADENNVDDEEEEEKEVEVVSEPSRNFRMGDIEGLKTFFRHRIDELTMKPVRGMVTSWIKQLEPRRLGGYGPYHRLLPAKAPADTTPPWWPQNVPYIEPAHLDKDGLLTLAVEVMLQHRDIAIDKAKRQVSPGWTSKLRQIAEFAIETTAEEHFSSSKSAVFSKLMKKRAMSSILPSLFDVSQTYEDYTHQYSLWTYANDQDIPKGRSITWQFVPRPPKQTAQRKRSRNARASRTYRADYDVNAHVGASGDDTEADETMEKISNTMLRQTQVSARRQAIAQAGQDDRAPQESVVKVSTPMTAAAGPASDSSQPSFHSKVTESTPSSSFDQSLGRLHLYEDVKGGSLATSKNPEQQARCDTKSLDQITQYQDPHASYTNTFQPMHGANSFTNSAHSSFTSFAAQPFIDASQFSMFNDTYPLQMGHSSLGPSMTANNMAYPYESEGMFAPTALGMAALPALAHTSFNGLPYDFGVDNQGAQHHYCEPEMVESTETQ